MLSLTAARADLGQEASGAAQSIAALAAFDPSAWQELFDTHYEKMHRFAYVRTGDHHIAEEVAAEVFLAAVKGIGRYKHTGAPFVSWLYRIARNITADHLERRRRRQVISLDGIELPSSAWDGGVDDATDIAAALSQLTSEQQEVIILRFFNGCSLQETAAVLKKSVGAAKLLQHRALASLRRRLTEGGQP